MENPEYRISLSDIKQSLIDTTETLAEAIDELERLTAELEAHTPTEEPDETSDTSSPSHARSDRPVSVEWHR